MSKTIVLEKPFAVKPYSKKELSGIMNISVYVLNSWIKSIEAEVGKPIAGVYNSRQVKRIIDEYGIPCQIVNEAA